MAALKEFDLHTPLDSNATLALLREFGFVRCVDFVTGDILKSLIDSFESAILYENYIYGYGKMSRFEELPHSLLSVSSLFSTPFFQQVVEGFWGKEVKLCTEYAFVLDTVYNVDTIYGHLHFDRRRQLKFMLYLTDVLSKDDGAFSVIPKSHVLGKEMYIESWKHVLRMSSSDSQEIERMADSTPDNHPNYKSLPFIANHPLFTDFNIKIEEVEPITGSAGTLIVFDTHTLHLGGHVCENHMRKSIRMHSFLS